jgi:hypothetical protein
MSADPSTWSDVWTFLFPPDIWTPIGEFLSTSFSVAFAFGTILFFAYVGLLYADTTKDVPGAWNPWVIFWIVVIILLIFLLIAWSLSPLKLFGVEVLTTAPNTCTGTHGSSEGGLCYENCKPGYHGVGVRCYADTFGIGAGTVLGLEPCPDDDSDGTHWVNLGLICTRWKSKCFYWGTDIIGHWWTGCPQSVGRLDHGGICPGPQDFGDYDNEIKEWQKAAAKGEPTTDPLTHQMETVAQAVAANHKTCADIEKVGTDKHTEKIDGMCYKKCPADYPEHVPGMPYLCYKGGDLSYDRGGGMVPPLFRFFGKYPYG